MALVVEDGTGLPNANAMASVASVDAYCAARGNTAWAALDLPTKEQRIVVATSALGDAKTYPFVGTKKTYEQRQPWPRIDAVENYGGPAIPDNIVPWRVEEAVAILAVEAGTTILQPVVPPSGNVKSEAVSSINVSYFGPEEGVGSAQFMPVSTAAMGVLDPILCEHAEGDLSYSERTALAGWQGDGAAHPRIFDIGMQDIPGTGQPGVIRKE